MKFMQSFRLFLSKSFVVSQIDKQNRQMWKQCRYHKGCALQNFCINPSCSVPLCPNCIQPHFCEPQSHQIVCLQSLITDTMEYMNVCVKGLQTQINCMRNELKPEEVHKQYLELIEKYRKQSIQKINQQYKILERELLINIQNVYSQYLHPFEYQMDHKLLLYNSYLKDLSQQQTILPVLITLSSSDQAKLAQVLFDAFKQRKQMFKKSLPTLQPALDGTLHVVSRNTGHIIDKTGSSRQLNSSRRLRGEQRPLERITVLQGKLQSVRKRYL